MIRGTSAQAVAAIKEVTAAQAGLTSQTRALSAETAGLNIPIGNVTQSFGRLSAQIGLTLLGFQAYNQGVRASAAIIKDVVNINEEFNRSVVGTAALLTSLSKSTPDLSTFAQSLDYARSSMVALDFAAVKYMATGRDIRTVFQQFATFGLVPVTQRDFDALGRITDAISVITVGQNRQVQLNQEIRALITGQVQPYDRLSQLIKNNVGDLKAWVQLHIQAHDLMPAIADQLKGFTLAQGSIQQLASTWANTLETVYRIIIRSSFTGAYDQIVKSLEQITRLFIDLNGNLTPFTQQIISGLATAFDYVGSAFKDFVNSVITNKEDILGFIQGLILLLGDALNLFNQIGKAFEGVATGAKALIADIQVLHGGAAGQAAIERATPDSSVIAPIFKSLQDAGILRPEVRDLLGEAARSGALRPSLPGGFGFGEPGGIGPQLRMPTLGLPPTAPDLRAYEQTKTGAEQGLGFYEKEYPGLFGAIKDAQQEERDRADAAKRAIKVHKDQLDEEHQHDVDYQKRRIELATREAEQEEKDREALTKRAAENLVWLYDQQVKLSKKAIDDEYTQRLGNIQQIARLNQAITVGGVGLTLGPAGPTFLDPEKARIDTIQQELVAYQQLLLWLRAVNSATNDMTSRIKETQNTIASLQSQLSTAQWSQLLHAVESVTNAVQKSFESLFTDIITGTKGFGDSLLSFFRSIGLSIVQEIARMVAQSVIEMSGLRQTIGNVFGGLFGFPGAGGAKTGGFLPAGAGFASTAATLASGVFGFQGGGIVTRPTLAMIGEAGPEAIVPLSRDYVPSGSGGSVRDVHIHINAVDPQSFQEVVYQHKDFFSSLLLGGMKADNSRLGRFVR